MRRARRFGAAMREAGALLTQARYLSQDLRPTAELGEGPTVILLHGLYASAGVWRPLRQRLIDEFQASTHSLSYVPGPSLEHMAGRIRELILGIGSSRPIYLVGHSFGGLAMRLYAASGVCDDRVAQTISLAAPFLGSEKNAWVPGAGGRDLTPGAPILDRLRRDSVENRRVPHLTIVGDEDSLIVPGAFPEYGRHVQISRVGHNGILFHQESLEYVIRCIDDKEKRHLHEENTAPSSQI